MLFNITKRIVVSGFSIAILLFFQQVTHACNCAVGSDCQAFSESKTVFVGRLLKTEAGVTMNRPVTHATFSIIKVFKGKSSTEPQTATVTFQNGECARVFEVDTEYLVFDESREIQSICNRSGRLSDLKSTKDYIAGLTIKHAELPLAAVVVGLSSENLSQSHFFVNSREINSREISPGTAMLSFKSAERKKYLIRMVFPIVADIEITDGLAVLTPNVEISSDERTTVLQYAVDLDLVPCDFKRITVSKR